MSEKYNVSFIDAETAKWLRDKAPEDGLCLKRFHADLMIEGLAEYNEGDVIVHDGTSYEIEKKGKGCFRECVLLKRTGQKCPLADGTAFGRKL